MALVQFNYFVVCVQKWFKRVKHVATQFEVAYCGSQGREAD